MATQRDFEKEILLRGVNAMDVATRRGLASALGVVERGIGDLEKARAARGTQISKAVTDYERALNGGATRAKIDAFVSLQRMQRELPIKFAEAAYTPNYALLEEVRKSLPASAMAGGNLKTDAVARIAWEAYLRSPRATDGNVLGTDLKMRETYGEPPSSLLASGSAILASYNQYTETLKVAKANAAQFENQMNHAELVATTFENFRAKNPEMDDNTAYAEFEKQYKNLMSDVPAPSAPGVELLRTYMEDPEKSPAFFSDIDKTIEERQAAKDKYLAMMGAGGEPAASVQDDERAMLAGWVRREDVRAWAKQHGFNLGQAVPVPPGSKLEADINAGYYPQSALVNGLLYTASPDDMRAAKLAYRQMQMDPQKNVLYNLGLAGDRTRRGMTEVEVRTNEPPPRLVSLGSRTGASGKEIQIGQLDDGSYAASEDDGATWAKLPEAGAQALVQGVTLEPVEAPLEAPGISAPTKKILIEERGSMYGDPMGSIRGVDRTPGSGGFNRPVVLDESQIVKRTRLGEERYRKPIGETVGGITAGMTEKREGFAPVDTTAEWNKQDIGKAPAPAAERARAATTRAMQALPSEPSAAVPEAVSPETTDLSTVGAVARPTSLQGQPGAVSGLLRPAPPLQSLPKRAGEVTTPNPEEIEIDMAATGTTTSKPVMPSASITPQRAAWAGLRTPPALLRLRPPELP